MGKRCTSTDRIVPSVTLGLQRGLGEARKCGGATFMCNPQAVTSKAGIQPLISRCQVQRAKSPYNVKQFGSVILLDFTWPDYQLRPENDPVGHPLCFENDDFTVCIVEVSKAYSSPPKAGYPDTLNNKLLPEYLKDPLAMPMTCHFIQHKRGRLNDSYD